MDKPKIRFAGASDPGRVRQNNEDALHLDAERGIFLVVDGIGGQAAGEKAAEIAVGRVRARLERQTGTVEQRIREAITMANNEILEAARGNPEWAGMACVLTVAVLENGSAVVGHVGDSRAYQIRGGRIQKITHDHSPVGEGTQACGLASRSRQRCSIRACPASVNAPLSSHSASGLKLARRLARLTMRGTCALCSCASWL